MYKLDRPLQWLVKTFRNTALVTSLVSGTVYAGGAADLGGPITLDGELNTDYNTNGSLSLDGYIRISAKISKNIKAVLKLELDRYFYENGEEVDDDFDVEKFVEEAYIAFKNNKGKLNAILIGKQAIHFGGHGSSMPNHHNSPIHDVKELEQVFAITVTFKDVGFFDVIEASVFESEQYDLSVGDINGMSVTLEKDVTEKLSISLSAARLKRESDETILSVGFINRFGKWKAYGEIIHRSGHLEGDEHENHEDDHHGGHHGHGSHGRVIGHADHGHFWEGNWAGVLGLARQLGPGTVALEFIAIENTLTQLALGYTLQISKNLSVGPEIRHTRKENGESDTSVAVRATIRFGGASSGHDHDREEEEDHDHDHDHGHDH